jgi:alcohol dehydrogenase (cytochrome c)/quinohemoprotein ethanol dehydrogenase
MGRRLAGLLAMVLAVAGCTAREAEAPAGAVTAERIVAARTDGADWLTTGRTYDEQRHSPLNQIHRGNVAQLGLAWFADLDTSRGQEATPIVIDGNLYVSTAWSMVKAYDGRTGRLLWSFDPQVPRERLAQICCDAVNRGVAAWGDTLFVGTLDGRLIALDRHTGRQRWSVVTVDQSRPYSITGAPRVIDGKVIIGNGGAEFGVRGYVTAYDARDGSQLWRFYTVPGNPADGFEGEHLRRAAATWHGEWWRLGGGGTVWDSMAYDPELDLLYIGVGNGSPWNQAYRSEGRGDNLYLSSIVAIRPDSGEYVWHYQTTPGETWDFTATQHIILADLTIDGRLRKVLMQAPKNGFFYVIDRATGELVSAENFVEMNWATGVDMATGRPIENPEARYYRTGRPFVSVPGASGAHSWHPMSFDPATGLVYIPAQDAGFPYFPEADWRPAPQGFNTGIDLGTAAMPAIAEARAAARQGTRGALIAWDPVAQRERWRVQYRGPWNGGVLSTAGGLVFQGSAAGDFAAFDAGSGRRLWTFPAQTGVVAAPVTYTIDGQQYVAVMAGWGGVWAIAPGILSDVSGPVRNVSRLLVFRLGGTARLPDPQPFAERALDPPADRGTPEQIAQGTALYGRFCGVCHGDAAISGALVPDLRYSATLENPDAWRGVVIDGALAENGMVSWRRVMNAEQADSIRHYVIRRAHEDRALAGREATR